MEFRLFVTFVITCALLRRVNCQSCTSNCVPKSSTELAVDRLATKVDNLALRLDEIKDLLTSKNSTEDLCDPILVQQNVDGSEYFQRTWQEYRNGFGTVSCNFWIGNEALHNLTTSPTAGRYRLRAIVWTLSGSRQFWAEYDTFRVDSEQNAYKLNVAGFRGSVEFDALAEHNGMRFSTYDRDNDIAPSANCAALYGGGSWYRDCAYVALNARKGAGYFFKWGFLPGDAAGALSYSKMMLVCR